MASFRRPTIAPHVCPTWCTVAWLLQYPYCPFLRCLLRWFRQCDHWISMVWLLLSIASPLHCTPLTFFWYSVSLISFPVLVFYLFFSLVSILLSLLFVLGLQWYEISEHLHPLLQRPTTQVQYHGASSFAFFCCCSGHLRFGDPPFSQVITVTISRSDAPLALVVGPHSIFNLPNGS